MIFKAGLLVIASVTAIAVTQIRINSPQKQRKNDSHSQQEQEKLHKIEEEKVDPKQEEVEVIKATSGIKHNMKQNEPIKSDCPVHEFLIHGKIVKNVTEINRLKDVVKEMDQRRVSVEVKLLELYGLEETQLFIVSQQKLLKDKMEEMDMLSIRVGALQDERTKLQKEIKLNLSKKTQLEIAKQKILDLKAKLHVFDAAEMKGKLMILEERVLGFHMEEESIQDDKVEKQLKAVKVVEMDILEMKRKNKEIQLEKRELAIKLVGVQAQIVAFSNMTEGKIIAKIGAERRNLIRANDGLSETVGTLHKERLDVIEELMYQRRLNACLMFELQDYRMPQSTTPKRDARKKLSFESQVENEKPMLNHSFGSMSSMKSSVESDPITDFTVNSSLSSERSARKKWGIIHSRKRWGRSRDDSSRPGLTRRFFMSMVPSNTSLLMKKDVHNQIESPEKKNLTRVRRVSFTDSVKPVGLAFQKVKKSEEMLTKTEVEDPIESPEKPNFSRVRRVSFDDSVKPVGLTFPKVKKSVECVSDNEQRSVNKFKNSSIIHKTEEEKSEKSLIRFNVIQANGSGTLSKQDDVVETSAVSQIAIANKEDLPSMKLNVDPSDKVSDRMVHLIAAFFFFLLFVCFILLQTGIY